MSPFVYQLELLKKYKQENEDAHKSYIDSILAGFVLTLQTTLTGPYVTHVTYFTSDDKSHSIIEPSSLAWANNIIEIY